MACVGYCWDEGCIGGCVGGCQNGCSDDGCSGNCGGFGCGSGCSGGCDSTCKGTCSGTCSGTCKTTCTGCKGTCNSECNKGCTTQSMVTIYNRLKELGLKEYIEKDNIQDIIDLVGNEVIRRGKIPTLDNLTQYETFVLATYFNNIKNNLINIDYSITYNNTKNNYVLTNMGNELINKALNAYETLVPVD